MARYKEFIIRARQMLRLYAARYYEDMIITVVTLVSLRRLPLSITLPSYCRYYFALSLRRY